MKIRQYMTTNVATVNAIDNLHDAAHLMWETDCGTLPVESDGVVGMITDRDIAMAAYLCGKPLNEILVKDIMSDMLFSCQQNDELSVAEKLMTINKVRRLPVMDDTNTLVGIISLNDIAVAYRSSEGKHVKAAEIADTLSSICSHREAATATAAKVKSTGKVITKAA